MANPSEEPATARLEIDTSLASNLQGLTLEVNDELVQEVQVGRPVSVALADALPPDERMILRFKAALPPDAPQGTTLPIDLRFFVGEQPEDDKLFQPIDRANP